MEISERFAANLSSCREGAGLTPPELANLATLSPSQVELAESGVWLPELEVIIRLAGSLDVTVGRLLEGIRWEPTESSPGRFNVSDLL